MRFTSFLIDGIQSWGVVEGSEVAVIGHWPSLRAAISEGAIIPGFEVPADATRLGVEDLDWLPVIPDPAKIFCIGLNYEDHRKETGRAVVAHPTVFVRFADSQTAHRKDIVLPPESDQLDYEGELAVIIGKGGRRIAAADALEHVAGYACYNDGSIRDWQSHSIQFIPGKTWPETGAFGPWMVTPDEFGPLGPQRLETWLNGALMQEAALSDMIFSVPRLIEYISTFSPLAPGDVIVSGTPGGVGAKRTPQVFMKPGDHVEVRIDGIGSLVNTIARRA